MIKIVSKVEIYICQKLDLSIYLLFLGFSIAPTPSGSYGDFQLLLVEEDPAYMNIRIFTCIGRTTDALQVSWKISLQESFCHD